MDKPKVHILGIVSFFREMLYYWDLDNIFGFSVIKSNLKLILLWQINVLKLGLIELILYQDKYLLQNTIEQLICIKT